MRIWPPNSQNTYKMFDVEINKCEFLKFEFDYQPKETKELRERLNDNSEIDICDLRRIALWKINRVLDISDETIEKLSELASMKEVNIEGQCVEELIGELVKCPGVGFPMASSMLKFIKPDIFPIIDVRAYRALTGKKPHNYTYSYQLYVDYTRELEKIAKQLGRPLREIDERLYEFDKQYNGKI